jgi:hypothetical protein
MIITNPDHAHVAIEQTASETARRLLTAVSVTAVAPESFPGKLDSRARLAERAQQVFEKASAEAASIAAAARTEIDALRRSELKADPFATACLHNVSRSVRELPGPLDLAGVRSVIAGLIDPVLVEACQGVDRDVVKKIKTKKGVERRRRRLKVGIDTFIQRLQPRLAAHIAGHVRDELADELKRRHEACDRAQSELRRHCANAVHPGEDVPGVHRFSCGPRVHVVLKAAAVRRPDVLDSDGRPTAAIWPAFGAEVTKRDLTVMEDPQRAIVALQRFLQATLADALAGVTLDGLYALANEQPEVPNWISRATARMHVSAKAPEPYRVRLAQVPATSTHVLYDQVRHHIQTATESAEPNRLQLMEFTYSYRAKEVLDADPRGLDRVLAAVLPHTSNPRLTKALQSWTVPPTISESGPSHPADRIVDNGQSQHVATA